MAKISRLEPFRELQFLDDIVRNGQGCYTHEDAFKLPVEFAYNLTLMNYERDAFQKRYEARAEDIRKLSSPKK